MYGVGEMILSSLLILMSIKVHYDKKKFTNVEFYNFTIFDQEYIAKVFWRVKNNKSRSSF